MVKPSFFVVGTQKAGTTTLHEILRQHPQIFLPKTKEAHFFDFDDTFTKGFDWWVETFFKECNSGKIAGAITPEYLFYPEVPLRIKEMLGVDVKIIIILRNPVDRAFSHYLMTKRRGLEALSFDQAVAKEAERLKAGRDFERVHYSYFSRGLYAKQVKRYLDLFGAKNVLILKFEEDFLKDKLATIEKILRFLNVSVIQLDVAKKSNSASRPRMPALSRFLYSRNWFKEKIKRIIVSKGIRKEIKNVLVFLDRLNQTKTRLEYLTLYQRKKYLKLFHEDIKKLSLLTAMSFQEWYE
ncbi:MAG TPA: sulfotransferase [Candidatus Omnitrophota bacterium]|nr:sulfotransferase [Candidatus Omnitrophota bacterium]